MIKIVKEERVNRRDEKGNFKFSCFWELFFCNL